MERFTALSDPRGRGRSQENYFRKLRTRTLDLQTSSDIMAKFVGRVLKCVCVWEGERERGREGGREREKCNEQRDVNYHGNIFLNMEIFLPKTLVSVFCNFQMLETLRQTNKNSSDKTWGLGVGGGWGDLHLCIHVK